MYKEKALHGRVFVRSSVAFFTAWYCIEQDSLVL